MLPVMQKELSASEVCSPVPTDLISEFEQAQRDYRRKLAFARKEFKKWLVAREIRKLPVIDWPLGMILGLADAIVHPCKICELCGIVHGPTHNGGRCSEEDD